jgi:hypothetical protein
MPPRDRVSSASADVEGQAIAKVLRSSATIITVGLLLIAAQMAFESAPPLVQWLKTGKPLLGLMGSGSAYIGLAVLLIGAALMAFAFILLRFTQDSAVRGPADKDAVGIPTPQQGEIAAETSSDLAANGPTTKGALRDAVDTAITETLNIPKDDRSPGILAQEYEQLVTPRFAVVEVRILAPPSTDLESKLRRVLVDRLQMLGVPSGNVRVGSVGAKP